MNSAHGNEPAQDRRSPRRIDARIDISPAGLVLNDEPVEVVGTEPWLAAGIRAAAERVARPTGRAIRARVVNGPHRTRMVVYPDGSVSDVEEYVLPMWLARGRAPLLTLAAAGVVCALIGAVLLASGGQRPAASPAPAMTSAGAGAIDDDHNEAMLAAATPVVVTARVAGGTGSVAVEATAEPRAQARWLLRNPDGDVVADRVVTLDAETRRLWHTGLAPGDYRWRLAPSGDGAVRHGTVTVTVTDGGAEPPTAAATPPEHRPAPDDAPTPGTPSSPGASDPAPGPGTAGPGTGSGSDPTPSKPGSGSNQPDPTTSKPDPTTPEPDPTTPTSEPDPTTPEPDPTTSEPDPTTSEPDPTSPSEPSSSSRSARPARASRSASA